MITMTFNEEEVAVLGGVLASQRVALSTDPVPEEHQDARDSAITVIDRLLDRLIKEIGLKVVVD